jgi:hypothetical protein
MPVKEEEDEDEKEEDLSLCILDSFKYYPAMCANVAVGSILPVYIPELHCIIMCARHIPRPTHPL